MPTADQPSAGDVPAAVADAPTAVGYTPSPTGSAPATPSAVNCWWPFLNLENKNALHVLKERATATPQMQGPYTRRDSEGGACTRADFPLT
mmetsp:Transcript_28049/g.47597  ORF Transcript_28049/g.47597 Transcript_28049/m.47597 type:complete len:91 (+) Transcript_28049:963-1235(+)